MEDIYLLTDAAIQSRVGDNLKSLRLRQNITQQKLAEDAGVSLSTVKKLEKGKIGSFDAFIRILRILGQLDVLSPLVEEPQLSPSEYYDLVQKAGSYRRKRAAGLRATEKVRSDVHNKREDEVW